MGHGLVFQLLKPLVELHVILISAGIVILASPCLAPVGFCEFEGAIDLVVEGSVPFACLTVESHCEHARLDTELQLAASVAVRGTKDTFLALIATSRATRNVA